MQIKTGAVERLLFLFAGMPVQRIIPSASSTASADNPPGRHHILGNLSIFAPLFNLNLSVHLHGIC